ncbi:MAG: orotate phosphoribosyltransferase [Thermoplasmata archaeon]|nr:MAG: orotate phosphoribosyltransferase [Thermoplasmata archaeon]
MSIDNLKEQLLSTEAVMFGEFTLTSGKKSNFYVNIKKASTQPEILKNISECMKVHLSDEQIIAGMELGAVPLAVALSLEAKLPYIIIRKQAREHGTGKQIEGNLPEGTKVLVVEDVATTGGSLVKTVNAIREAGGIVERAIVVVDREEGGAEAANELKVELIPLVKISELLEEKK